MSDINESPKNISGENVLATVDTVFQSPTVNAAVVPGCVGLMNLGNTCFMNSGLQCLFSNSVIAKYFIEGFKIDQNNKDTLAGCFAGMVRRCWAGKHRVLIPDKFKNSCLQRFQDYQQQDCQEFLMVCLDGLNEILKEATDPTDSNTASNNSKVSMEAPSSEGMNEEVSAFEESSESGICMSDRDVCKAVTGTVDMLDDMFKETNVQSSTTHCTSVDSNLSDGEDSQNTESLNENAVLPPIVGINNNVNNDQAEFLSSFFVSTSSLFRTQPVAVDDGVESMETDSAETKAPSYEDIYMKEARTLNTNVQVDDVVTTVSTDSVKFHKPLNTNVNEFKEATEKTGDGMSFTNDVADKPPPQNDGSARDVILNDIYKVQDINPKNVRSPGKVKDTNLRADANEKHAAGVSKDNLVDGDRQNINNAKRKKIDSDNRMTKVAYVRNVSKEQDRGEGCSSHGRPSDHWTSTYEFAVEEGGVLRDHSANIQRRAREAWADSHKSIIDDTFKGLFMNTLECHECHHKSVSFNPFVFLTLPIPWATQLRLSVILLKNYGNPARRYIVTIDRNSSVSQLTEEVRSLSSISKFITILIAEVEHRHIVRILDDQMIVKNVDPNLQLYALEVNPEDFVHPGFVPDRIRRSSNCSSNYIPKDDVSLPSSIRCGQDLDEEALQPAISEELLDLELNQRNECDVTLNNSSLNNVVSNEVKLESSPDINWQHNQLDDTMEPLTEQDVTATWSSKKCINKNWRQQTAEWIKNTQFGGEEEKPQEDMAVSSTQDTTSSAPFRVKDVGPWRTCAICLEEMVDGSLMVHPPCEGTLCHGCLEMSFRADNFGPRCPVCRCSVTPITDFIPLDGLKDHKPQTRVIRLHVMCRMQYGKMSTDLFGHPNVIHIPSQTNGIDLYLALQLIHGCNKKGFKVVTTDSKGLKCSRCPTFEHCTGCELKKDDPSIVFQPGDHLTVAYSKFDLTEKDLIEANAVYGDQMEAETTGPLSLLDCIESFMKSDTIAWDCPTCKESRNATKTMTVWKYPNTLIVHLMRFSFHKLTDKITTSDKIDSEISFPVKDLDLSHHGCNNDDQRLLYDLQSYVCHYGDLNKGHYTALTKHPVSGEWFKYSDESRKKEDPSEADFSAAYLLFYQRKDSSVTFELPKDDLFDGHSPEFHSLPKRGRTSSDSDLSRHSRHSLLD